MSNEETIKVKLGVYDFSNLLAYRALCNDYYDYQINSCRRSGDEYAGENVIGLMAERDDMNRIVMQVFGDIHEKIVNGSKSVEVVDR